MKNLRDVVIFFLAGIVFIGGMSTAILSFIPESGTHPEIVITCVLATLFLFSLLYYFLVYRPKKRRG